jgi:FixJ family two-component response regulator
LQEILEHHAAAYRVACFEDAQSFLDPAERDECAVDVVDIQLTLAWDPNQLHEQRPG